MLLKKDERVAAYLHLHLMPSWWRLSSSASYAERCASGRSPPGRSTRKTAPVAIQRCLISCAGFAESYVTRFRTAGKSPSSRPSSVRCSSSCSHCWWLPLPFKTRGYNPL